MKRIWMMGFPENVKYASPPIPTCCFYILNILTDGAPENY
jgi:hypothetical protein